MQNQTQTVTQIPGQMPGTVADGEIVLLDKAFRQRQLNAPLIAGKSSHSECLFERSNVAFLRKELPAETVQRLSALCADLAINYARTAKMCEVHTATYGLCIAGHKRMAVLSDAKHQLRTISGSSSPLHERRRVLAAIFDSALGVSGEGDDPAGGEFRKCLNDDALPVDLRIGLAVLYAEVRQSLRQIGALRRAVDEG